jgi:uncharacterized protein YdeI (YjbR/CyaY-like superfamily)
MNPKVDFYFKKAVKWKEEIGKLRTIVLDCHLVEELKWGCPCYIYEKSNIVLIHVFKEYCALLFMKGVLLKDPKGILIQQTENVQSGRQIRFTSLKEIVELEPVIKAYIFEAIEVEESGLKVELKKTSEYKVPEEFQKRLEENLELKTAFEALTPGRQKGYLYYFSQPKTAKTREQRVEKSVPLILDGKGIDD